MEVIAMNLVRFAIAVMEARDPNYLADSSHVVDILSSITTEEAGTKSHHYDKRKTI
jgi:hypothetical protein